MINKFTSLDLMKIIHIFLQTAFILTIFYSPLLPVTGRHFFTPMTRLPLTLVVCPQHNYINSV